MAGRGYDDAPIPRSDPASTTIRNDGDDAPRPSRQPLRLSDAPLNDAPRRRDDDDSPSVLNDHDNDLPRKHNDGDDAPGDAPIPVSDSGDPRVPGDCGG